MPTRSATTVADRLKGGAGADVLEGGAGAGDVPRGIEHLSGTIHADTIGGDGGANRLEGGAGAEVEAFAKIDREETGPIFSIETARPRPRVIR